MKALALFSTFLFVSVCNVAAQDLEVRCFSCGYIIQLNGTKTPIEDGVQLCGDFADDSDNIVPAGVDGCCASYKYEIDDVNTGEKLTVARHGTADDGDEVWVQLPCMYYEEENAPDEQCKTQNMTIGGDVFDAVACHCYTDLCNDHVPELPNSTAATTPAINLIATLSLNGLVMVSALFLMKA